VQPTCWYSTSARSGAGSRPVTAEITCPTTGGIGVPTFSGSAGVGVGVGVAVGLGEAAGDDVGVGVGVASPDPEHATANAARRPERRRVVRFFILR
jgi:hypothetical protein